VWTAAKEGVVSYTDDQLAEGEWSKWLIWIACETVVRIRMVGIAMCPGVDLSDDLKCHRLSTFEFRRGSFCGRISPKCRGKEPFPADTGAHEV